MLARTTPHLLHRPCLSVLCASSKVDLIRWRLSSGTLLRTLLLVGGTLLIRPMSWRLGAAGSKQSGQESGQGSRKRLARPAGAEAAEVDTSDVMGEMGAPWLQMSVGMQGKVRQLQGTVEHTHLIARTHQLIKCLSAAGTKWTEEAAEIRKRGGQEAIEKELGPPHLIKGLKLLEFLTMAEMPPQFQPEQKALREWLETLNKGALEEALSLVRYCWTTTAFDKENQVQQDRVAFHFEGCLLLNPTTVQPVNQVVDRLMRQLGSQQKGGAPPPMSAERKLRTFTKSLFQG